jgi:hypothetical protein
MDVGIECKRPRSDKRLNRVISDAAGQLNDRGRKGFVLVDVEALLLRVSDENKLGVLSAESPASLHAGFRDHLDRLVKGAGEGIDLAFDKGAWGVFFCANGIGVSESPSALVSSRVAQGVANLGAGSHPVLFAELRDALNHAPPAE